MTDDEKRILQMLLYRHWFDRHKDDVDIALHFVLTEPKERADRFTRLLREFLAADDTWDQKAEFVWATLQNRSARPDPVQWLREILNLVEQAEAANT